MWTRCETENSKPPPCTHSLSNELSDYTADDRYWDFHDVCDYDDSGARKSAVGHAGWGATKSGQNGILNISFDKDDTLRLRGIC